MAKLGGARAGHKALEWLNRSELKGTEMNTNAVEQVPDVDVERVCDVDVASLDDQILEFVVDGASLEDRIREFVQDNPPIHESIETSESAVNGVCSLVQRVAGTSLKEIDDVIVKLQQLRVFLVSEGERLQRELTDYGKLTMATLRSSRIITDSLPSCKLIADNTGTD
jgi:hypothetical protein